MLFDCEVQRGKRLMCKQQQNCMHRVHSISICTTTNVILVNKLHDTHTRPPPPRACQLLFVSNANCKREKRHERHDRLCYASEWMRLRTAAIKVKFFAVVNTVLRQCVFVGFQLNAIPRCVWCLGSVDGCRQSTITTWQYCCYYDIYLWSIVYHNCQFTCFEIQFSHKNLFNQKCLDIIVIVWVCDWLRVLLFVVVVIYVSACVSYGVCRKRLCEPKTFYSFFSLFFSFLFFHIFVGFWVPTTSWFTHEHISSCPLNHIYLMTDIVVNVTTSTIVCTQ